MVKEYTRRLLTCFVGVMLCGMACSLGAMAGSVGTNAWNTLAIGIQNHTGLTFGRASLIVSITILLIDIVGRGKLGLGTVINVFFTAYFSDFFLAVLDFLPAADSWGLGLVYTLTGQVMLSFATLMYMAPGLGAGPRDTLMVLVGKKMPRVPIGMARFTIEMAALLAGLVLGAPFGIGTVLIVALQASIFQLACKVTKIEPRVIVQEDFAATFRRIRKKG